MGDWQNYVNSKYGKKKEAATTAASSAKNEVTRLYNQQQAATSAPSALAQNEVTRLYNQQQTARQAAQAQREAAEAQARADAIKELQGRATALGQIGSAFGQGIGNFASAIANSPITAAVANTAQRAGSIAAGTLGDALKNTATQKAGAVDRFMAENPDGLMTNTRPELQNNFLTAYLDRMNYTGPRTRGDMLDIGERSAAMDERLEMLLNDMSHPEEWQQYIEDNGINWALGEDRRMDEELALKQLQADMIAAENNNKATREKWAALRNTDATSEEALQAMEEAGGEYAQAAQMYRHSLERAEEPQTIDLAALAMPDFVNGQLVTNGAAQGTWANRPQQGPMIEDEQITDALRDAWKRLRQESLNAVDDDYRAKEAAFYDAQEALRAGWGADYERGALSDYEKLTKAEDDAYEALLEARREDYRTGYENAQAEAGEADTWMRLYYATLPGRSDFDENGKEGPYQKPTAEERLPYEAPGNALPDEMTNRLFMTETERKTANYLYNTEGPEAAEKYISSIQSTIYGRRMEDTEQRSYQLGQDAPLLGALVARGANLLNPAAGTLYMAGQAAKSLGSNIANSWLGLPVERQEFELDPNNPAFSAGVGRDAMDAGVMSTMGDGTLGNIFKTIYNWSRGAIDSRAMDVLTGGFGEIYTSLGAMVDSTRQALENGAEGGRAALAGAADGVIELLTEHIGSEKMSDFIFGTKESIMRELLKMAASEGIEETVGGILEPVADLLIMTDKSELQQSVNAYMKQGMTEEAAWGRAIGDTLAGLPEQFAAGAWGGLLLGGGAKTTQAAYNGVAKALAKYDINKMSDVYGKAASVFKNNWDGQMMPGLYKAAFDALYDSGADGTPIEAVRDAAPEIMGQMDEARQETIWQAGKNAAEAEARAAAGEATEITENGTVNTPNETEYGINGTESGINGTESGINGTAAQAYEQTTAQQQAEARWQQQNEAQRQAARYDAQTVTPGVVRQFTAQRLTHDQRSQIRILDELGKHYGVEFDIVDSIAGGGINGSYANGKRITVSLDAANQAYVQVGAHEMVHYIKGMDTDAYAVLESIVTDALNETEGYDLQGEIQARMAEYARAGQKLTEAEALEEIVAEAVPTVFTDRQAVRELVNQNRTLAQKIRDFITDFVDTLREIAFNYFDRNNRAEIAALLGETERLTEIAKTFDAALDVAGEAADRNAGAQTQQAEEMAASVKYNQTQHGMKRAQFELIQRTNPMTDDYHLGIRKEEDIKTAKEALETRDDDEQYVYPDWKWEDGQRALKSGKVTLYSSHQIKAGTFVSPSRMMASDYAGDGKIYSKTVSVNDVAWINADEGQYAPVRDQMTENSAADMAERMGEQLKNKTRFSMAAPVERVGELVAVHNLEVSDLRNAYKRGGFVSPSIAVTKAAMGHEEFGTISVVFSASTVDPQADAKNRIYGQDAWTPSFPRFMHEQSNEDILEYMNKKQEKDASARGAAGLVIAASKEYGSLDDVRDDSDRLMEAEYDDYKQLTADLDNWIDDFCNKVSDYNIGKRRMLTANAVETALLDAAKVYAKGSNLAQATKAFDKQGVLLTDEQAREMEALIKAAQEVPTEYFEAKPKRIVGFDEIAAIIAPAEMIEMDEDNEPADPDLYKVFKPFMDMGIQVLPYEHWRGSTRTRVDVLNSIDQPGVRFSLANTSENSVDTERVLGGINGRPAIKVSGVNETAAEARKRFEARKATQTKEQADKAAMRGQTEAMKLAREVLREYESQYSKTAMRDNMIALMGEIAKNGVSDDTLREATQLARAIIEQSKHVDTTLRDQYKDLRKTLRETPITLTETQRQEAANIAGDMNAFRKSVFGTFNIAKEGKSLDAIWQEWSDMAPDLFPPETSEGDMLQQLISVRAAFMPQVSNPYGMDMDGASTELGLRMQERLLKAIGDDAGAREMEAAVNELRRQYADALNEERLRLKREQRAAFDRIAEQLKAARGAGDREAARRAMTDYRAQMKRIGAEQAEAQARLAYRLHYEDRTARAKAYERIRKYAEGLRRMLAKPDKNKHVPAAIQGDLLAVLDAIDFTRDGRETEGTRAWKQSLRTIGDYLARQLDIQTSNAEEAGHEGIWMSLCEPELEQLRESMQVIMRAGKSLSSMTMEELSAFSNAMSIIQHSVNSINQLWTNERHETMDALGVATMRELGAIRDNRAQNSSVAALRAIDNMLNVENLDAGSFFERLGGENGAAYSIFEELRKGQSAAYARVREASEAAPEILGFTDDNKAARTKTIRNWAKETCIFELPVIRNGEAKLEKVTMTGTQLMELYALSRRPQARMHLLSGGMRIAGRDGKTGDSRIWKMDEGQLESMLNALSDDQKKTVERMQNYLSTTVSEWGNDVTEKMYLYRMFGEDNYWPIKSEKGFMRTKEQNGSVLFNALTNAGFTKQTQDVVRNPIMIGDAIETFSGHISDMATFSGLAMPVDDFLRWYNYADRDENGHVSYTDSVKKEIERTTGKGGLSFVQNILDDLNGMGKKAPVSGIVDWAMGNYKRAAIMAKLRVVIQQPTAILRASAMINPKYLASALTTVGGHNIEEMQQHSALAWWKSNGNYEIGTGESMKSIITGMQDSVKDDIFEKLNSPAGKADDLGWRAIWLAVKRETAAEHKDLEVGSEAYWQHVTERFEDICMKTQVVDTVLTRSGMMRSKDSLMKMATAFMSEPTKNFNLMRTGLSELYGAIQSKNKAAQRRAEAKVLRGGAAITAATALNAVMTALFDALKYYNPDDDKDEWGESAGFWSAMGMNWVNDMLDGVNPLANIPFVKDIWEIATGGDVERMDMSAASRLYSAVTRAWKYAQGNPNSYTTWAALKPMITSAGDLMGMPVSGLVADAEFTINAARNIMGKGAMSQKLASATSAGAYAALYDAVSSDDARKADQLRAELRKKGKTNEQISQGLADQLALEDDRVRQAWEARQAGQARVTANLKKEIMADGFTEGEAVRAINRYDDVIKNDAKALWLKAKEQGREDKAAEYEQKLRSVGVTDEDMAKWTAEKDMDAELKEKGLFERANLYEAIRSREATDADILDIRDYLAEHSEAKDPVSSLASSVSSEFREEYIGLINAGKTQEAERLKARLMTAGVKKKTIDEWAPKAAKNELADTVKKAVERGDAEAAAAEIERMIDEEIMDVSAMVTRLNNEYKPRYIELMNAGKEAEAEALAETLSGLNLKKKNGENYYRGSVFNQWMNDWEKQQEEDE